MENIENIEKFWEIFDNKEFDDFIDRTYVYIKDIKNQQNMENISKEVDTLIRTFPISTENSPYVGIYGLPGSGKSTLARQVSENHNIPVISTDKFLADLKEQYEQDSKFPPAQHDNEFRKHEYKVICCLFLSGVAKNSIIDFGGAALLQPGLGLISKKVLGDTLINLKIDDKERVLNLAQDAVLEQGYRTAIKEKVKELKEKDIKKFEGLRKSFVTLKQECSNLEDIRNRINNLLFEDICNYCKKVDENNKWKLDPFEKYSKSLNYTRACEMLNEKIVIDQRGYSV